LISKHFSASGPPRFPWWGGGAQSCRWELFLEGDGLDECSLEREFILQVLAYLLLQMLPGAEREQYLTKAGPKQPLWRNGNPSK
jgi:hypothetical protein